MAPIEISDFAPEGVILAASDAPDFDARAQEILAGRAAPMLDVKPFLAIVANRSPRTVVAYTVSWAATLRNESTEIHHTQFKFADAVAGAGNGLSMLQGREIRTGEERLVGMGFEVWPLEYVESYRDFGLQAAERFADMKGLRIALDAVIFDDGALLGPDESHLAEHYIAFVQAKQTLYGDIVVALESGDVRDDVFAPLRELLAEPRTFSPADPLGLYARQSAVEALGFRDRVVLEAFRRALRREPFTIRRAGSPEVY